MLALPAYARLRLMVWCASCQRVWRRPDLIGAPPHLACPVASCNDGIPGDLLPYHALRRLVSLRWPRSPVKGRRYPLHP